MSSLKYVRDIPNMKKIKVSGMTVIEDPETSIFYYSACPECTLLLSEDEMAFGHDCE